MGEEQLAARGVTDPHVLAVLRRVPRHRFVQEALRDRAYGDHPLPIGEEQTISQPFIVGAGGHAVRRPLVQQLADGGRMVLPVGSADNQVLTIVENLGGEIRTSTHSECKFVKLVGKYAWEP